MVFGTKIHSGVVFSVERWSFSLQDLFLFWYFLDFRDLFQLNMLLWRPLFVYFGHCGMKETGQLLRMRSPLLSG